MPTLPMTFSSSVSQTAWITSTRVRSLHRRYGGSPLTPVFVAAKCVRVCVLSIVEGWEFQKRQMLLRHPLFSSTPLLSQSQWDLDGVSSAACCFAARSILSAQSLFILSSFSRQAVLYLWVLSRMMFSIRDLHFVGKTRSSLGVVASFDRLAFYNISECPCFSSQVRHVHDVYVDDEQFHETLGLDMSSSSCSIFQRCPKRPSILSTVG